MLKTLKRCNILFWSSSWRARIGWPTIPVSPDTGRSVLNLAWMVTLLSDAIALGRWRMCCLPRWPHTQRLGPLSSQSPGSGLSQWNLEPTSQHFHVFWVLSHVANPLWQGTHMLCRLWVSQNDIYYFLLYICQTIIRQVKEKETWETVLKQHYGKNEYFNRISDNF